jgi:hypothetical protein
MREDRILGWDFGGEIPIDEVTLQRSSMDTFWLAERRNMLANGSWPKLWYSSVTILWVIVRDIAFLNRLVTEPIDLDL